jgi:acyl dehydratase
MFKLSVGKGLRGRAAPAYRDAERLARMRLERDPGAMTADEMKAAIGRESVSDWITVSQDMIDKFADATGDHQFIHVDPERAKLTPFGTTIAHGFLTLSLLPQIAAKTPDAPRLDGVKMGVNYGGNKVRFLAPVPSGSNIRGRSKITEFEEKRPGQFQYTTETTIEIEGSDKPAMIAEWITQVFV